MPQRARARTGARRGLPCAAVCLALRWGVATAEAERQRAAEAAGFAEAAPEIFALAADDVRGWRSLISAMVKPATYHVPHRRHAKNTLNESMADFRLGAGSLHGALLDADVLALFGDHLSASREMLLECGGGPCFKAPLRSATGQACTVGITPGRPTCETADPELCFQTLMPLLQRAVVQAQKRLQELQTKLRAAELANSAQAPQLLWQSRAPPRSGHALAANRLVDELLGFFLAVLERMDYNPRLAACLGTPVGQEIRKAVVAALEHRDVVERQLRALRWNLATKSLVEGRHGWHSMFSRMASEVSEQAHWLVWRLLQLPVHVQLLRDQRGQAEALRLLPTELEEGAEQEYGLLAREAMYMGAAFDSAEPDRGLLRFMLAEVLRKGDRVCDLGAFVGRYAAWLNDTGLVTAHAYDAAPGIEQHTQGRVRHANLVDPSLDVGQCDVSLCLEVLEHISKQGEAPALRNLGRHSGRALVASWALPDTPAVGHVNTKSAVESREAIERATGLRQDETLTRAARAASEVSWIRESVAVFLRH
ncbi:unnamed protein product [Prorocentrum cordatum]|uniref:Methyltransferase type 11 domain-containing protein n=1 Tax=Prorocentrum cordatum TaxID=2364126 RepID=A0ABN9W282_9DINO|nr:unnamed protein product [Polarella glacialis]